MKSTRSLQALCEGGVINPPRFASDSHDDTRPHLVELDVQRALLAHPRLRFSSLVVRRIDNGVCLQGVLETDEDTPDVCSIAQRVAGVTQVLNRLVLAPVRDFVVRT